MSAAKSRGPAAAVELDRTETHGYVEVLWSTGICIRSTVFGNLDRARLTAEERAHRRRQRRARKLARRRNGDRLNGALRRHGLTWETIRYFRHP